MSASADGERNDKRLSSDGNAAGGQVVAAITGNLAPVPTTPPSAAAGAARSVPVLRTRLPTVAGAQMAATKSLARRWMAGWPPRNAVVAVPDHGEPLLGGIELTDDQVLDISVKRGVRAQDELAQRRTRGPYLRTSFESIGPVVWTMPTPLSVKSDP